MEAIVGRAPSKSANRAQECGPDNKLVGFALDDPRADQSSRISQNWMMESRGQGSWRCAAPSKMPVHSASAPQSNLNISQFAPATVAFSADSTCELDASVAGRFWRIRINKKLFSEMPQSLRLVMGRASPWWTRHRIIDHTILTSMRATQPRPIVEWRVTGSDNQAQGILIRTMPFPCFFPITTVNRIRANTSPPCGRIEDFPSRQEFWPEFWWRRPWQLCSRCFLPMPHATSSPTPRLRLPFLRLRLPRSRILGN
jgi:hypothetical protein